jgi:hypothetical protein
MMVTTRTLRDPHREGGSDLAARGSRETLIKQLLAARWLRTRG